MKKVILTFPFPISGNHYYHYYRGKIFRSPHAKKYINDCRILAYQQLGLYKPFKGKVWMATILECKDERRRDLDNFIGKCLYDMLMAINLIQDDDQIYFETRMKIKKSPVHQVRLVLGDFESFPESFEQEIYQLFKKSK